jgi:hypothetical protein
MIGVLPALLKEIPEAQMKRLLGHRSVASGVYRRENGDLTPALPLAKHLYYVAKGWTLVTVSTTSGMLSPEALASPDPSTQR